MSTPNLNGEADNKITEKPRTKKDTLKIDALKDFMKGYDTQKERHISAIEKIMKKQLILKRRDQNRIGAEGLDAIDDIEEDSNEDDDDDDRTKENGMKTPKKGSNKNQVASQPLKKTPTIAKEPEKNKFERVKFIKKNFLQKVFTLDFMITFFGIAGLLVNAIEHEIFYKGGD